MREIKFTKGDRFLLFGFVGITSINTLISIDNPLKYRDFLIAFNSTIFLGVSLFWVLIELFILIKEFRNMKGS